MIPGIEEKRLVNGVVQNGWPSYATLHQASVSLQDMGDRVITTQVRIDGDVVPDFSGWELYFKGERFVLPSDNPQASKDNSTRNSIVDLQFQSWVIQELKRYYFFSVVSTAAGTIMPDQYRVPVRLTLPEFVALCNNVLEYYFGNKIVMSLYPGTTYATEPSVVEIDYTHIWDVVGKIFEIYGVRWIVKHETTTDIYTISIGESPAPIADHDFEYGYKGGLLKFERQVQDETITNILLGRGGEKNLPYRYFKLSEGFDGEVPASQESIEENRYWAGDPDAIPELASIGFDRLRDANFRWYIRGWMHNPHRDTSGDEAWDSGHVFPTYEISQDSPYYWAYHKGLVEDESFDPVEYVKDDASIEAYGERWGALEDNDEVYPTIQGRYAPSGALDVGRIDEVVAVSEIETDDIDVMAAEATIEKSINPMLVNRPGSNPYEILTDWFEIPTGQTGNISSAWVGPTEGDGVTHIDTTQSSLVALDSNGTAHPISGLSAGQYRLRLTLKLYVPDGHTTAGTWGLENIKLTTSAQDANAWKPTFDIWVKNIWNTQYQDSAHPNETPEKYSERVWREILGDRVGNEAKVVFSTGFMSISEDYEFQIASYPAFDQSKSIRTTDAQGNTITVPSEWRITLRKSDAEYDATGLFIPNASTGGKPIAGDKFFFTGIDMPFLYVTLGEEDLNTNKSSQLEGLSVVNPTWVISLDKVRVHTLEDGEYGQTLADRLAAGAKLRITDPRFSGGDILTLYAQSITYTWNEPSENSPYIVPDIEVVLSDKVVSRQSRADKMESSIQEIRSNYARLDDVERVVRSVAEPMFLKKTGEADSSDSPTQFASKVSSKGFRQGGVGGNGWGFYRDNTKEVAEGEEGEGDSVLEVDRVVVRKELQVNSLVVNQTEYRGGREIQSAAQIECTKVVVDDSGKYVCYFDQKQGSVKNLFVVGDFAYSTEFAPDNTVVKYYRRRVDAVDVDRVVLSDTVKDGAGVPAAGDVIIQYGHESNTARQYVIVRDVIGGGYERMISGLSTVSSNGSEYYFAGRQSGQYSNLPRWFVGAAAGEYAEYLNGQLNIKGRLQVLGESGNYSDLGYLADALPKKGATLIQGGLVLTSMIQLGQVENSAFKVYSGINGKVDETLSDPTKTIAAWYGGEMLEKTAWDAMSAEDKLAHQYAKTIYRFDGSGYLAGGNIHWDENGYGGIPGITWSRPSGSQNDVITIGSNVILEAGQGADQSVAALVSSVNSLQQILDWFEEVNLGDAQNPAWAVRLKKKTVGSSQLARAFVTYGDQIVNSGTPGGGGSAGKSYLHELLDVYGNPGDVQRADGTARQSGDLLGYNSTLDKWVAIAQSAITPDMSNYYTKSETYSKTEVNNLIGAIDQFHYEIYASTSAVTDPQSNVLYLIGPTGSGADRYEEYVYTNSTWTKIGDTSIDLSGYVQSSAVKTLSLSVGSTSIGTFNPVGAGNASWTISAQNLYDAIGASKYHPYGGSTSENTFKIGGATFTWHPASGSTPGYIEIDSALVTKGDQIVVSGTPGGGGGGAGYLYELGDVYGTTAVLRADGTEKQVGDVLQYYDSTKGWVAVPSTSIGITTDATQSAHGLMSAADKTKLDYVGFGAAGSDYVPVYLGGSTPTNVLTAHQSLAGYVTLNTDQTINSIKTFVGSVFIKNSATLIAFLPWNNETYIESTTANGSANAPLWITGVRGTEGSSLYLDFANIYATASQYSVLHSGNYSNYALPLTGGTINPTSGNAVLGFAVNSTTYGVIEVSSSSFYIGHQGADFPAIKLVPAQSYPLFRYGGVDYILYHSGNSNKSDVPWTASKINFGANGDYIDNGGTGYGGALRVHTADGNAWFGAMNNSYCHIYTDRDSFYFNKATLYANGGGNLIYHGGNSNKSDVSWTCYGLNAYNVIKSCANTNAQILLENDNGVANITAFYNNGWHNLTINGDILALNPANGTGNVAVGTTSPWQGKFFVSGNIWANGAIYSTDGATQIRFVCANNETYIQSQKYANNINAPLKITGYSGTEGSSLYLQFANVYATINNYAVLHAGNYGNYALPLSAGSSYPLTGDLFTNSAIIWKVSGTQRGMLGATATDVLSWYANGDWRTIYHSGNSNKSDVAWTSSTMSAYGGLKSVGVRIYGADGTLTNGWYSTKIETVHEGQSPSYLNGAMVFYTMYNSYLDGTETEKMRLTSNGCLMIGYNYNLGYKLGVNGNAYINGSITSSGDQVITSDLTKKENFEPIVLSAKDISKVFVGTFDWKDGRGKSFGTVAQDWTKLMPSAVLGKEGDYSFAYAQAGVVIGVNNAREIYALQTHESEQDKEIRLLKEKVKKQAGEIRGLRKEIERLRMN